LEAILELLLGLAGATLGAIATLFAVWLNKVFIRRVQLEERTERNRVEEEKAKRALTLQLFLQWDDTNTLRSRVIANKILKANPGSYVSLMDSVGPEDWVHVAKIFHFYEMLGELVKSDQIDAPLYRALFGRVARFWVPVLCSRIEMSERESPEEPEIDNRLSAIRLAGAAVQMVPV